MATCLVVQHVAPERPYAFADALADEGVAVHLVRTFAGEPPPSTVAGFDGLLVMGGPMSARTDDGFPSRRAELALLADAVARAVPTIGVCLGAQLLAAAAGGSVVAGASGPEIGWGEVALSAEAADDPLLAGAGPRLEVLHWHGDTFDLPRGAVLLASSDRYSNQAFRIGDAAWGLQFHVEADREATAAFVAAFGDEVAAAGGDPSAVVSGAPTTVGGARRLVATRWATRVATGDPSGGSLGAASAHP